MLLNILPNKVILKKLPQVILCTLLSQLIKTSIFPLTVKLDKTCVGSEQGERQGVKYALKEKPHEFHETQDPM